MAKKEKKKIELPRGLTFPRLRKIFRMFCIHQIEYHNDSFTDIHKNCDRCILKDIPWMDGNTEKTLCHAVWQKRILDVPNA